MVDFSQLIKAGLHFGHQTSRWCPKMAPYIWGQRGGVHLLDISKIAYSLDKAAAFLESVAAEGKTVLWVGTKKPAKELIVNTATALSMPYVDHRWVGGTLTNFYQVKKAVAKYLHYQDVIAKASASDAIHHYTKKELGGFQKTSDRMEKTVGGLKELRMPLGALVVIDVRKEITAIQEANAAGIPVVALVDTNGDPSGIDFVIPGNDDSPNGIQLVLEYLAARVAKGAEYAKANSITPVVVEDMVEGATEDIEKAAKAAAKKVKVVAKGGKSAPVKRGGKPVSPKAKAAEVVEEDDSEDEA